MTRGFTLLEVIIYIALLSLVMGGTLAATYELLAGQSRAEGHAVTGEEGSFVLGKLTWMMGAATTSSAIITPTPGTSGGTLRMLIGDGTPYEMCLAGGAIRLSTTTCSAASEPLTSGNVEVTSLDFRHIGSALGAPAGLSATTTLQDTATHKVMTFTFTRYLRQ